MSFDDVLWDMIGRVDCAWNGIVIGRLVGRMLLLFLDECIGKDLHNVWSNQPWNWSNQCGIKASNPDGI